MENPAKYLKAVTIMFKRESATQKMGIGSM